MKKFIHLTAGYLSVMGLGFIFACLILGATEYLLSVAVFMVICAVISIITKPDEVSLRLDK